MSCTSYSNSSLISPLEFWFRRQGTSNTLIESKNSKLRLPRIVEDIDETKKKTAQLGKTSSAKLNSIKNSKKNIYRSKTPNSNFFYERCIEDVFESNHPRDLKFDLPRELVYVRSLPFLKYVTYGTGKSFESRWKLEMFID